MAGGYEVATSQLEAHASQTDAVADRVEKANAAAQEVGVGGVGMYGLLCSPLILPALHIFFGDTDDLVNSAADLGRACAEGIRETQKTYDQLEQEIKALMENIG